MKKFFLECLRDLEDLTGIRQLFFLQSDVDGARRRDILIDGMVLKSKEFSYIPEEEQKRIIRKMMVEDQNYDALNARIIHKWLDMHKTGFIVDNKFDLKLTPAEELPSDEVVAKYVKQFEENMLKIGKPKAVNGFKEIREELGIKSVAAGIQGRMTAQQFTEKMMIREAVHRRYSNLNFSDMTGFAIHDIEGRQIYARDEFEAHEIWEEVKVTLALKNQPNQYAIQGKGNTEEVLPDPGSIGNAEREAQLPALLAEANEHPGEEKLH